LLKGGGLVATEHILAPNGGTASRFQTERPQVNAPRWQGRVNRKKFWILPVKNRIGEGRTVYLPEVIPAIEKPAAEEMRSRFWKLPVNWKLLAESVKWVAGGELAVETDAPETVTIELTRKNDGTYIMLHLLNYGYEKNAVVKNIRVSMSIPGDRKRKRDSDSPDTEKSQVLNFRVVMRIDFVVPILQIYDLVAGEMNIAGFPLYPETSLFSRIIYFK
jgi:hypothetical protein